MPFPRAFAYFTEVILNVQSTFIKFTNSLNISLPGLEISNMPNNKRPRKMSTSRGSCLNTYQTYGLRKYLIFLWLNSLSGKFFGSVNGNIQTNMLHTRFEQQRKRYSKLIWLLNLTGQIMQNLSILKIACSI